MSWRPLPLTFAAVLGLVATGPLGGLVAVWSAATTSAGRGRSVAVAATALLVAAGVATTLPVADLVVTPGFAALRTDASWLARVAGSMVVGWCVSAWDAEARRRDFDPMEDEAQQARRDG